MPNQRLITLRESLNLSDYDLGSYVIHRPFWFRLMPEITSCKLECECERIALSHSTDKVYDAVVKEKIGALCRYHVDLYLAGWLK